MKKIIFFSLFLFFGQILLGQSEKICKMYFIRHAEKVRDKSTDPLLTEAGEERAIHWANVFKEVDFDAVYSTETLRTVATALPSAAQNNLEIVLYDAKEIDIVALAKQNLGKTLLIVGHSNSTPNLVNNLIGVNRYTEIDDNNFSHLYIVTYTKKAADVSLLFVE